MVNVPCNTLLEIITSGIVNGARGFIHDFEHVRRKDKSEKLVRIWVVFPDKSTGSILREDSKKKGISNENPHAVPISEVKATFEIPNIKIKVHRTQFPMVILALNFD